MNQNLTVHFTDSKAIETEVGGHSIKTDMPPERGGEGSAPTPTQLFMTSLASCTAYYALEFCKMRKIETTGMKFEMHCDWDEKTQRYTRFAMELTLPEGFPEKYKKAIVRTMDSCFIKKHVLTPPEFVLTAV